MANLKPTNEEFSDSSYNNDSRLSQPSSGVRQVRNVQTDKRYDPNKRRGGAEERAASTWGAGMQAGEDRADKKKKEQQKTRTEGIRSVAATQYQNAGQGAQTSTSVTSVGKKRRGKKLKISKSAAGGVVGRSVTLSIWSWGFFIWMWFQVPIAIFSIVFMALTEAVYQFSIVLEPTDENGVIVTGIKGVASLLTDYYAWLAIKVTAIFGLDLEVFNPANGFMLTHLLVMFVGWGMLLVIGIIYIMTGQKAFSGKGAAGKNGMFMLALIGYAIPIFNILPLFFFWTLMVLKNPR